MLHGHICSTTGIYATTRIYATWSTYICYIVDLRLVYMLHGHICSTTGSNFIGLV